MGCYQLANAANSKSKANSNANANAKLNDVDFRFFYEGYFYYTRLQYADSLFNLGNEVLLLPEQSGTADQRADFKLVINDGKFVFRPRVVSQIQQAKTEYTLKDEIKTEHHWNITDLFYEQQWTSQFSSTLGLQVYQWGPAEFLNVSNPFFHFNSQQKTLTYKEKGHVLARFNIDVADGHNLVFIAEPVSNNESYWYADEKFQPQAALKYEWQSAAADKYVGLVLGKPDQADFFIGEYGQIQFDSLSLSGFSLYADLKHTASQKYYEPVDRINFVEMSLGDYKNKMSSLAVVGLRYEGDFDIRLEYIYNSLGYTLEQQELALVGIAQLSPYQLQNILRFQKNGLELFSQNYLYASFRKSNPFSWQDFNFYFRSLTSLTDSSGMEQIEMDKNIGDYVGLLGSFSLFRGQRDSEFRLINDWTASVGFKLMF